MAAREVKLHQRYQELKRFKKYDIMDPDYDSYEQSDYELDEQDLYPKMKK